MGTEIGELMCSQDRNGGNSSKRSCIFTVQANEWVLNSTDFCNKVHTSPILHIYLLHAFLLILL